MTTFGKDFAAAFRAVDGASERVYVRAGTNAWWTAKAAPSAAGDRPTLVELDSEHLLLLYTLGTDPHDSGNADVGRLRVAVLSTKQEGMVDSQPLVPESEPFSSDPTLEQRRPRAVRVGSRIYLAWEHAGPVPSSLGDELTLEEVAWSESDATHLERVAEPHFTVDAPDVGDQRSPVLASSALFPEGALIMAWEDYSGAWPGNRKPEVVMALRPSPIVVLP